MRTSAKNRRRSDATRRSETTSAVAGNWLRRVLIPLAILVGCAGTALGVREAYAYALATERLALWNVQIHGIGRTSEDALIRLGGLTLGTNLLALDTESLERALESHPWVARATVRRDFPHRLDIVVTERVAVALLSLGELYIVDASGEPFQRLTSEERIDVPLITGIDRKLFVDKRSDFAEAIRPAIALILAYNASPASQDARLSEVVVRANGLSALTEKGEQIDFQPTGFAKPLERLVAVRLALRTRGLVGQVIRLNNRARGNWVTVTPATLGTRISMR